MSKRRLIVPRDRDWPLPDRPDHPAYQAVLALAAEGDMRLLREVAYHDFWFFCRHVLTLGMLVCKDPRQVGFFGKHWLDHPWCFARCREIQAAPDGFIDLWARFHFKTAFITQSFPLWELCEQPDLRFMVITNKISSTGESFLYQVKNECEINELLPRLWPGTFWRNPRKEAAIWNEEEIQMRVALNPKEASISIASLRAGGTSKHVDRRIWDDLVTEEEVRSRNAIEDTTERWKRFSGTAADYTADRYVGTHWAVNDTYRFILDIGAAKLRRHDVYEPDGATPVLRSTEWVEGQKVHMGSYNFACQMRNAPVSAGLQLFDLSWLRRYEMDAADRAKGLNTYIFIDTANSKKKDSDYNVLAAIGLGHGVPLGNYSLLDLVRDRIGLVRFTEILFEMVERWRPRWVFIEQIGASRDDQHVKAEMERLNSYFRIMAISERLQKEDRIKRLQPIFEAGRFFLPDHIMSRTNGARVDLVQVFKRDEYEPWSPTHGAPHDDILDCISQITWPTVKPYLRFPTRVGSSPSELEDAWRGRRGRRRGGDGANHAAWAI